MGELPQRQRFGSWDEAMPSKPAEPGTRQRLLTCRGGSHSDLQGQIDTVVVMLTSVFLDPDGSDAESLIDGFIHALAMCREEGFQRVWLPQLPW